MEDEKPAGGEGSVWRRAWQRVVHLPLPWKLAIAAIVLVAAGLGSLQLYRTYEYVQHDNDFCLSCHIMERPFQRFARSAHRGLSCKACHQPTFAARSRMALTQFMEQPDTLSAHAEVPNQRCAECHIEGDPKRWRQISQTAGHKIHLESDDPELQGLQCVECHSTSLHEFAPTRRTCGQAGCHEDVQIELGDMAGLTVHCIVCHDFTAPTAGADSAVAQMQPEREECLSCHAMREQVQIPADEPHGGVCSTCHQPHEQQTPAEAVATCTESGCHSRPDTLPNFHHEAEGVRLEQCTDCHEPHEFRVREDNCLGCHSDILGGSRTSLLDRGTSPAAGATAELWTDGEPPYRLVARLASADRSPGSLVALGALDAPPPPQEADTIPRFRHAQHEIVDCQVCHNTGQPTTPSNPSFCRSCHHRRSSARGCTACHRPQQLARADITVRRTMDLSVGSGGERTLPFPHAAHDSVSCTRCHTNPPRLSAANVVCTECHENHHDGVAFCADCHRAPPDSAHPLSAHVTCTGSGCHESIPFESPPRSRPVCETCHREMTDHKVGRECVTCHVLPAHPPDEGRPQ